MKKILEIDPQYIEKIWGGDFFSDILKNKKIGECILFSANLNVRECFEKNKKRQKKVKEIIENKKNILGEKIYNEILSLEIKIIDANENLSIQVHPKNKDEMWYVLKNKKNAYIYLELRNGVDKEMLKKEDILNKLKIYKVKKEDCIYIPGGVVHSLGKGIRVLEIKEKGKTYRLFDFDRGRTLEKKNGIKELLVEEKGIIQKKKRDGLIGVIGIWEIYKINFTGTKKFLLSEKVCIFVFIEGQGIIECSDEKKEYYAGKLYLIFAENEIINIQGSGKIIMLFNKGKK